MGYNSTLVICNDVMSAMESDPEGWVQKAINNLMSSELYKGPVAFGHGYSANGFWAVTNTHADAVSVIAVGGNYASVLGQFHWGNSGHHEEEQQVELLKQLADKYGYRLVKKSKKP
jgi:hypothetical protein